MTRSRDESMARCSIRSQRLPRASVPGRAGRDQEAESEGEAEPVAVLTRPDAAPASSATPAMPALVSGAKAEPWPAPTRTMGRAIEVR